MSTELSVAVEAARRAGAAIREIYRRENLAVVHKPDHKGPLTEADLASDAIIAALIRESFATDAILSEETVDSPVRLASTRCWIVDPLDGTREFTLGLPEFCVSIGFVVAEQPRIGVLYNPITDELVAAEVGHGTTLDGAPVTVSTRASIDGARLLVSRNEMEKGWFDAWNDQTTMTPMGSVAWKLALVACGRAEATFTPKPRNEWDLCAGVAAVIAAGGRTSDGAGEAYRFNQPDPLKIGVFGTNGLLHDAVLAMVGRR